MHFWYLIRFRWRLVTAVFLASVSTAVAWSNASTPVYSSRIRFLAMPLFYTCSVIAPSPEVVKKERLAYRASQIALFKSRENLTNTVQRLNLVAIYAQRASQPQMSMETAIKILRRNVTVTMDPLKFSIKETALNILHGDFTLTRETLDPQIEVTVLDQDPKLAAAIANQLCASFRELRLQPMRRGQESGLATLKEQLRCLEAEVDAAKANLQELEAAEK